MRVAEYIVIDDTPQVIYRDAEDDEIIELSNQSEEPEKTLDELLEELNELKAKIENKLSEQ